MCTAVTYRTKDHYFGRTLDLEFSYDETVTVTPRNYPFHFRKVESLSEHYAIIGMAYVEDTYPLYYDATNEKGLSIAGLNFPGNAYYGPFCEGKDNIAPFELIPWVLGQCSTVREARELLDKVNLVNINYSEQLPLSPLHWMIADRESAITAEPLKEGLKIYDNPIGVLTNNPPFDSQMFQLNDYRNVSAYTPGNRFAADVPLTVYSRGMGGIGLPGDLSSSSRFVRAAFVAKNSVSGDSESESISQFFHILGAVEQQRGCVRLEEDKYEITVYTSCCNAAKGIYYYTTYENHQITAVDMHKADPEGTELISYPLIKGQQIYRQN